MNKSDSYSYMNILKIYLYMYVGVTFIVTLSLKYMTDVGVIIYYLSYKSKHRLAHRKACIQRYNNTPIDDNATVYSVCTSGWVVH